MKTKQITMAQSNNRNELMDIFKIHVNTRAYMSLDVKNRTVFVNTDIFVFEPAQYNIICTY